MILQYNVHEECGKVFLFLLVSGKAFIYLLTYFIIIYLFTGGGASVDTGIYGLLTE